MAAKTTEHLCIYVNMFLKDPVCVWSGENTQSVVGDWLSALPTSFPRRAHAYMTGKQEVHWQEGVELWESVPTMLASSPGQVGLDGA